jgi:hypothetical protein
MKLASFHNPRPPSQRHPSFIPLRHPRVRKWDWVRSAAHLSPSRNERLASFPNPRPPSQRHPSLIPRRHPRVRKWDWVRSVTLDVAFQERWMCGFTLNCHALSGTLATCVRYYGLPHFHSPISPTRYSRSTSTVSRTPILIALLSPAMESSNHESRGRRSSTAPTGPHHPRRPK